MDFIWHFLSHLSNILLEFSFSATCFQLYVVLYSSNWKLVNLKPEKLWKWKREMVGGAKASKWTFNDEYFSYFFLKSHFPSPMLRALFAVGTLFQSWDVKTNLTPKGWHSMHTSIVGIYALGRGKGGRGKKYLIFLGLFQMSFFSPFFTIFFVCEMKDDMSFHM